MGFEEGIKNALDDYAVPYNSADWTQLEKRMDAEKGRGKFSSVLFYGALITAAITIGGVLWYMQSEGPADQGFDVTDPPLVLETPEEENAGADQIADHNTERTNDETAISESDHVASRSGSSQAVDNHSLNSSPAIRGSEIKGNSSSNPREVQPGNSRLNSNREPSHQNGLSNTSVRDKNDQQNSMVAFSANVSEGCPGTTIDFQANNIPDSDIFLWNFGDGSFSNKPSPEHQFDKPGIYNVTLSVTSLESGAIRSAPATDRIIIHDAPYSDFSWDLKAENNEIPTIHFENTSRSGVKWHWDMGDGTTSQESHPEHTFKEKGTYQVTLTATNANGCIDQVTKMVEVKNDYKLLAPNTFSPNGDGTNDLFIPEALKILDVHFKMTIFEPKTGRLIYETREANAPWNGRLNNKGAACEKGEYVWVIDIMDGFNAKESYNGKVTLLR